MIYLWLFMIIILSFVIKKDRKDYFEWFNK